MASVVSKIKDALQGGGTASEDARTGRADMTNAERERGAGTHGQGSSNIPGSFPGSEHEGVSNRHTDGSDYARPQGTHVDQGPSGHEQPGTHTGHGQSGYNQSGRQVNDEDKLMDPASRGTGSNVLGGNAGGAGAGAVTHEAQSGSHNKLHKRDDPRGYEPGTTTSSHPTSNTHHDQGQHAYESTTQSSKLPQSYESGNTSSSQPHSSKHHAHGQSGHEGVTGASNALRDQHDNRQGYAGDTYGSQHEKHATHGHGATTDSSHLSRDQRETTQGYTGHHNSSSQHGKHDPARTAAATAGGAGVGGLAASQAPEHSRHHDESSRHFNGAKEPYGSTGQTTRQDHAGGDSTGRSGGGIYNTVAGHGSNEDTAAGTGRSTDKGYDSHSGVNPGQGGRHAVPREAGDSNTGSGTAAGLAAAGTGAYGASQSGRQRDPYSSTGRAGDQSRSDYGPGGQTTTHGQQPYTSSSHRGVDPSSEIGTAHSTGAHQPMSSAQHGQGAMDRASNAASGAGGAVPSSGAGSTGGRAPHSGAKVMHGCAHCGKDNDISHYFKKDLVFRIAH